MTSERFASRRAGVLSAHLAAALAAVAALAAPIAGGNLAVPISAILTGGGASSGGALRNVSAIGGNAAAMQGGTLSVTPGVLAGPRAASLSVESAHAYPTPYMPSRGHDRVTFTRLPVEATIKVFTLSGRLIKTLSKNDSTDALVWMPVSDDRGSSLASGVYLFTIIHPGLGSRKGKLMIIK